MKVKTNHFYASICFTKTTLSLSCVAIRTSHHQELGQRSGWRCWWNKIQAHASSARWLLLMRSDRASNLALCLKFKTGRKESHRRYLYFQRCNQESNYTGGQDAARVRKRSESFWRTWWIHDTRVLLKTMEYDHLKQINTLSKQIHIKISLHIYMLPAISWKC